MALTQQELQDAAQEVERQAHENPGKAIEVDPEVAEYMGASPDDSTDFENEAS